MFGGSPIKLHDDIYLYKNFIPQDKLNIILNEVKSTPLDLWNKTSNAQYITYTIDSMKYLTDKIEEIKPEGLDLFFNNSASLLTPGGSYGEHTDVNKVEHLMELIESYVEGDTYEEIDYPQYGIVFYLNDDFTGGDIKYPDLNIKHSPEPGDLLIHKATIKHDVDQVLSGERYTHTDVFTKRMKMKLVQNGL